MRGLSFLHHTFAAAACIALASPSVVAAQSSEQALAPSSPWQLDAGETRCRLAREFGEAPENHLLIMETYAPAAYVSLILAGPAMRKVHWRKRIELHFGELKPIAIADPERGVFGDHGTGFLAISTPLNEPGVEPAIQDERSPAHPVEVKSANALPSIPSVRFADVKGLRVTQGDRVLVSLEMRGLDRALEALNDCSQNFISYWGLDLEKHKSMRQGPRWTNYDSIRKAIFSKVPRRAVRQGDWGVIRTLVIVDEEGQVSECHQSDGSQLKFFKLPVCDEMQRAQFEPALDAEGNPMRSYQTNFFGIAPPD